LLLICDSAATPTTDKVRVRVRVGKVRVELKLRCLQSVAIHKPTPTTKVRN
jgi:hypothetical protein